MPKEPQTEEEIYDDAKLLLRKLLFHGKKTIYELEKESKEVSEIPLNRLTVLAGFTTTRDFIFSWFSDVVKFVSYDTIEFLDDLFGTEDLINVVNLHRKQLAEPKNNRGRNGATGNRGYRGAARGRGGGCFQPRPYRYSPAPSSSTSAYHSQPPRLPDNNRPMQPNIQPSLNPPPRVAPSASGHVRPPPGLERYSPRSQSPHPLLNVNEADLEQISPEYTSNSRNRFTFDHRGLSDPYSINTARTGGEDNYGEEQTHSQKPFPQLKQQNYEDDQWDNYNQSRSVRHERGNSDPYEINTARTGGDNYDRTQREQPRNDNNYPHQTHLPPRARPPPGFETSRNSDNDRYRENQTYSPQHFSERKQPRYEEDHRNNNYPSSARGPPGFDDRHNVNEHPQHQNGFVQHRYEDEYNDQRGDEWNEHRRQQPLNREYDERKIQQPSPSSRQYADDHYNDEPESSRVQPEIEENLTTLNLPINRGERKLTKGVVCASKYGDYFVKLPFTGAQEKDLRVALRQVECFDINNPYSNMLCVYFQSNIPHRAQILNFVDQDSVEIELVDVGVFLTVYLNDLKEVDSDMLIRHPRFALPCVVDDEAQLIMEKATDGFDRLSTNKSIAMYISIEKDINNKNYVLVKLI